VAQVPAGVEVPVARRDEFLPLLLSLAGMHNPSLRRRLSDGGDGVLDESVAYFATAMRQRPASAVQIARVLSEYFCQPVRAEQFIGAWYDGRPADHAGHGQRGAGWRRHGRRARLAARPAHAAGDRTAGPEGYESFLPGGKAARALESMLTMFTGVSLEYEVQLVLRAEDVQGARLDEMLRRAAGLGQFPGHRAQRHDRSDVRYEIHTS
jgi:type VI secretion system protein ImpH